MTVGAGGVGLLTVTVVLVVVAIVVAAETGAGAGSGKTAVEAAGAGVGVTARFWSASEFGEDGAGVEAVSEAMAEGAVETGGAMEAVDGWWLRVFE